MSLQDLYEKSCKESEDRGYPLADLRKITREIAYRRQTWERKFDEYIEAAMIRALQWRSPAQLEDPTRDANIIVQRAAELADLRDAMLAEKFSTLDAALREEE